MSVLRTFAERIERLHEEKRSIETDIKEVYAELAAEGYDKKAMREVIKRRAKDPTEASEFEAIVDLYLREINGSSRAHAHDARDAREAKEHQTAQLQAERDPQSAQHGSDSVGGSGGESPHLTTGSEQESAVEPQARNEPGSAIAASGGEGRNPLPETRPVTKIIAGEIDLTIPAFLDRRVKRPEARS